MRHLSAGAAILTVVAVVAMLAVVTVAAGCSSSERARDTQGITPTYDKTTGKLKELTYDSNHNGRVDTWTTMDGARPVLSRIDRNEDGKIDRWEYYGDQGQLVKVGFSRKDDGVPDAWAFSGPDGRIERLETSSVADEKKIDRWEHYDATGLVSAEEDTKGDGAPHKWETYQSGALRTVAFDENGDGKPDRRLLYDAGVLIAIETAPDSSGRYAKRVDVK
jgi:hypothetical protein